MKETITLTISKSVGYSGKGGIRQYIARITGTSKQYIFERSFEDTECTDKVEMFRIRRKGKGSWTEAAALPPGLYERSRSGDREYLIVYMAKDGTGAKWKPITEERCIKMACLLDDGESFDEAMKQTSPPKVAPPEVAESGKLAELAAMEIAVARRREELASGAEYGGDEAMSTTPTTGDSEPAEPCPF